MALDVVIRDGGGRGGQARVLNGQELLVSVHTSPPLLPQKSRIFRAYLQTAAGSSDMDVDGSTTTVLFYVAAVQDADRYITTLNFYVGYGTAGELFEWADAAAALANGFRLYYDHNIDEIDIHDAITTNADLLRLCVKDLLPTAWEIRHLAANNDYGYICTIDLANMVPPYGVKLDMGSSQRLVWAVRDNITVATDVMNAIAYGFDRLE